MDTKLIAISFLVLALELAVLLGDLGFIPYSLFDNSSAESVTNQRPLGKISIATNNVRKKGQHSFVWEESENSQILFSKDSVLTLEDSTAKVDLEGDISIKLYENTLIVIEPMTDIAGDSNSIHLNFQKGDLRSILRNKELRLSSKDWSFKAEKGSDLAFRSLADGDLEIEVNSGELQVVNKAKPQESLQMKKGSQWQLGKKQVSEKRKISEQLSWDSKDFKRKYTPTQEAQVSLNWNGEPISLEIIPPNKKLYELALESNEVEAKQKDIMLSLGTNYIRLKNEQGEISSTLSVEIRQAPQFSYMYPLPRDRLLLDKDNLFSWKKIRDAYRYQLEVGSYPSFETPMEIIETSSAFVDARLKSTGVLSWRVTAFDQEGFKIVSDEFRRFFSVSEALKAPALGPIKKIRTPSSVPQKNREKKTKSHLPKSDTSKLSRPLDSYLNLIVDLLIPSAYASDKNTPQEQKYEFTWQDVGGADFYIIEIAETENFYNLLDTDKVSQPSYVWSSTKKGSVFWRVAGGANSGKMGLFSPAQKIKLSEIKLKKVIEKKRQIEVAVEAAKPDPELVVKPKKVEVSTGTNIEAEYESVDKIVIAPEPISTRANLRSELSLYTGVRYSKEKSNIQKEDSSYNFDGVIPLEINLERKLFDAEKLDKLYDLSIEYSQWEPEDPSALSFQEKINLLKFQLSYYAYPTKYGLLGISLNQRPYIKRASNETVEAKAHQALKLRLYKQLDNIMRELDQAFYHVGIGGGEDFIEIDASLQGYWEVYANEYYQWQVMSQLAFDLWQDMDNSKWGHRLNFGIGIKINWKSSKPQKQQQ